MTPGRILVAIRAALVAAIMASGALENDYRHTGDPAFCGLKSACFKLRASETGQQIAEWLAPYHLTLPQLGLFAFIGMLVFSFFLKSRTFLQGFVAANVLGGASAIYLIAAQAKLHTFCPYCMTVDTSMLIAAALSLVLLVPLKTEKAVDEKLVPSMSGAMTLGWSAVAAIATVGPYVFAAYPPSPSLPEPIAAMQVPGKVTVVSITDFECPFCRGAHDTLAQIRKMPNVAFKRVMAPLPFHPGAEPAALLYLCAPDAVKDDLAEKLYTVDDSELTPDGVRRAGKEFGLDPDAMKTCMDSDETKAKLEADKKIFEAVGGQGLPTTFIGKQTLVGFSPTATPPKMLEAVANANEKGFELPTWGLFVLVGAAIGAMGAFAWKRTGPAASGATSAAEPSPAPVVTSEKGEDE